MNDIHNIPTLRTFKIKFLGPTNHRGARVKIKDLYWNKSKIISYDYSASNITDIAINYLSVYNKKVVAKSHSENCSYIHIKGFEKIF